MPTSTAHVDLSGGLGNQLFALSNLFESKDPMCACRKYTPSLNPHSTVDYINTLFPSVPQSCDEVRTHTVPVFHRFHDGVKKVVSMMSMKKNSIDAAFLHIRGGDYRGHPIHNILTDGYYEKAVKHFPPDTLFYVLTNDTEYAKSFEFLKSIQYQIIDCNEIEGLEYMGSCKRGGICANSTYSWWGAVIDTNRTLVIPSRWTNDLKWNTQSDYRFPGAIVEDVGIDVYCIHLAHRVDRMQHIDHLRRKYPRIRFHIVDAIEDSDGARGCLRSHKKAIDIAVSKNLPSILVIEDDCDFLLLEDELLNAIYSALEYLPTVDIISGCGNLIEFTTSRVGNVGQSVFMKSPEIRTTHCILYRESSYSKILALPDTTIIDIEINKLNTVFTYPYLATQLPSYSDIEHKDVNYDNILRSQAFVKDILEGRSSDQTLNKEINPRSIFRIPIRTNRV